jgi:hypothetical protein
MKKVSVLFAEKNSIYNQFPDVEVYDLVRNAYTFDFRTPVVCHPPCRLFGRLRQFSTAPVNEKLYAWWCVHVVRSCGGVLEHPESSKLWSEANLPFGSSFDQFGGFTLKVFQSQFNFPAAKPTWLYICGVKPLNLPNYPILQSPVSACIGRSNRSLKLPELPHSLRSSTTHSFAQFLLNVARTCSPYNYSLNT